MKTPGEPEDLKPEDDESHFESQFELHDECHATIQCRDTSDLLMSPAAHEPAVLYTTARLLASGRAPAYETRQRGEKFRTR
jgi:hypothetical protein